MARTTSDVPEPYRAGVVEIRVEDFHVSELAADTAGAQSPFGQDIEFPLPVDKLRYRHPGPSDRPNLAGA